MNYEAKNLPYGLFEKIGMTKKEVLAMPKEDLLALLSGRTTSLRDITVKTDHGEIKEKAKLSLYAMPDNSLSIKVHPLRQTIQNDYNLSPKDIEKLKAGELVVGTKISQNGEREKHIFQLDREINEIKSVRANSISVPNKIDQTLLTHDQKSGLLDGRTVDLVDAKGEIKTVRIDLLHTKGFVMLNGQQEAKQTLSEGLGVKEPAYKELMNRAKGAENNPSDKKELTNGYKR